MTTLPPYGPFHRVQSPTQDRATALLIETSGELWGRPPRGSVVPQVQAWVGALPSDKSGIEFWCEARPADGTPPHETRWRPGGDGVMLVSGTARIKVVVTRNTQR